MTLREREPVRLSLTVSPELNDALERLARQKHTTKSEVLRKAFTLYSVAAEAEARHQRVGILDQDKQVVSEIIGL